MSESNRAKPITPDQMKDPSVLLRRFPAGVIETWNKLIESRWDGTSAHILQDDAADALMTRMNVNRSVVFEQKWLDIETVYRAEGWGVLYQKPGYNETGVASFTFTPKAGS